MCKRGFVGVKQNGSQQSGINFTEGDSREKRSERIRSAAVELLRGVDFEGETF
ncbi:MAG: hypothetical protein LBG04_02045 [Holosporaceae bacterium]|nr:hypothetical protein [Holosporaceae bacterium]